MDEDQVRISAKLFGETHVVVAENVAGGRFVFLPPKGDLVNLNTQKAIAAADALIKAVGRIESFSQSASTLQETVERAVSSDNPDDLADLLKILSLIEAGLIKLRDDKSSGTEEAVDAVSAVRLCATARNAFQSVTGVRPFMPAALVSNLLFVAESAQIEGLKLRLSPAFSIMQYCAARAFAEEIGGSATVDDRELKVKDAAGRVVCVVPLPQPDHRAAAERLYEYLR